MLDEGNSKVKSKMRLIILFFCVYIWLENFNRTNVLCLSFLPCLNANILKIVRAHSKVNLV